MSRTQTQISDYYRYEGGANREANLRQPNQHVEMLNLIPLPEGGYRKRPALEAYNTSVISNGEGFLGCYHVTYPQTAGTRDKSRIVWAVDRTVANGGPALMYGAPQTGGASPLTAYTWPGTGPTLTRPSQTIAGRWSFTSARPSATSGQQEVVYGCNGVDEPVRLTGPDESNLTANYAYPLFNATWGGHTTWAAHFGTSGNPHFVTFHRDRLVWLKGNEIFWSAGYPNIDNSATGTPTSRYLQIGPIDGDFCVCAASIDDVLYVFKQRSIWKVEGILDDAGQLRPGQTRVSRIANGIGCVARDTLIVVGHFALCLSHKGVLLLPAGGEPKTVSDSIWNGIDYSDNETGLKSFHENYVHEAVAVWYNDRYRLALTTTWAADRDYNWLWWECQVEWPVDVQDYSSVGLAWRRMEARASDGERFGPGCWCTAVDANNDPVLFFGEHGDGSSGRGWIYKYDEKTPDQLGDVTRGSTTRVDIYWTIDYGGVPSDASPTVRKRILKVIPDLRALGEYLDYTVYPTTGGGDGQSGTFAVPEYLFKFDDIGFDTNGKLADIHTGAIYAAGAGNSLETVKGVAQVHIDQGKLGPVKSAGVRFSGYGVGSIRFVGFAVEWFYLGGRTKR